MFVRNVVIGRGVCRNISSLNWHAQPFNGIVDRGVPRVPLRLYSTKEEEKEKEKGPLAVPFSAPNVTFLGAITNITLSGTKFSVGLLTNSPALLSDAAHSLSDLSTDAVAYYTYKKAREPKDFDHPYGHGKYEAVGSVAVGSLLILTGLGVCYNSLSSLHSLISSLPPPQLLSPSLPPSYALLTSLTSVILKETLYRLTLSTGIHTSSSVIIANAHHHRSDAYSSLIAALGIGGSLCLGLDYLDPVAGVGVSFMVLKSGFDVCEGSVRELLDEQIDPINLKDIANVISSVNGVKLKGDGAVVGRRMGPCVWVDAEITVDGKLSASGAHQLGEHCRRNVLRKFDYVGEVKIHFDPSPRQEYLPGGPELRDTPDVFERKINAILKGRRDILGFTDVEVLYDRSGRVNLNLNIIMPKDATIGKCNEVAREVRKILMERIEECADVDVDLELEEMGEEEKRIVVYKEEKNALGHIHTHTRKV
ncbi:hypothetical protein TrVE_jg9119 [Triparma verrucosa]|uniref:Cation efflux protein cytoplasmic domain-containing protein n=1 Tax=Triparma verrucosa TaxID=1606542 RepID=A0A9W7BE45_9STRA|nr:hypothetical protein TrVE_jg9119 [Triparma verrucosa]